jgi:hypothetical protein
MTGVLIHLAACVPASIPAAGGGTRFSQARRMCPDTLTLAVSTPSSSKRKPFVKSSASLALPPARVRPPPRPRLRAAHQDVPEGIPIEHAGARVAPGGPLAAGRGQAAPRAHLPESGQRHRPKKSTARNGIEGKRGRGGGWRNTRPGRRSPWTAFESMAEPPLPPGTGLKRCASRLFDRRGNRATMAPAPARAGRSLRIVAMRVRS